MKYTRLRKRYHSPLYFSHSDSGSPLFEQLDFPSTNSLSRNMYCHPTWGSSSTSDSETEDQEILDLSNYLPCWPVTGRRGRHSTISLGEERDIENKNKKSVLESEPTGNKGDSPTKKLTTGERRRIDGTIGTSVEVNTLMEKGKGKPVMESDDDFGNISEDGFDIENSSSIIPSEEFHMSTKIHRRKTYKKKLNYSRERNTDTNLTDQTRLPCHGTKEESLSLGGSNQMVPKVLSFDLNDLPPMQDEDDAIELQPTSGSAGLARKV